MANRRRWSNYWYTVFPTDNKHGDIHTTGGGRAGVGVTSRIEITSRDVDGERENVGNDAMFISPPASPTSL